jgi:hypothetical protein
VVWVIHGAIDGVAWARRRPAVMKNRRLGTAVIDGEVACGFCDVGDLQVCLVEID